MERYVERRISVSIPDEVYDIIEDMCYEEIDGLKIKRRSLSDVARELILKGLREVIRVEG